MVKKRIAIVLLSLLLCVAFSYAWINDFLKPEGRYMSFSFKDGNAKIASREFEVKLFYDETGDDNFVNMTNIIATGSEPELQLFENFAPGAQKKFRVDIVNNGTTPLYLNVVLSDIDCDVSMREYLEIGTSGYEGFPATTITPKPDGRTLAAGLDGESFILTENVEIPAGGKTVSVYFYVMFSRAATEALSNKQFEIGKINFMAV